MGHVTHIKQKSRKSQIDYNKTLQDIAVLQEKYKETLHSKESEADIPHENSVSFIKGSQDSAQQNRLENLKNSSSKNIVENNQNSHDSKRNSCKKSNWNKTVNKNSLTNSSETLSTDLQGECKNITKHESDDHSELDNEKNEVNQLYKDFI